MVSERIQRRIDALLDEADEAAATKSWSIVLENARAVLGIDAANDDARAFQQMATAAMQEAPEVASSDSRSAFAAHEPATNTPEPAHPDSFVAGRYRVERFLGDGAKKRVFLARDNSLDRQVAFAQLRTEGLDSMGRQRLVREAQAMARLGNHPRLVGIYDIGEEDGTPFIVEEYMEGGDLAAQLREAEGGLPLPDVLSVGQSICEALAFIHEKQLLHRDLKPSNVFLAEDGSAKVGDFGLAVSLDRTRLTTESSLIGTPSYMPPEQALGGAIDARSDLYSLGAMLYELVTGRPPFVGDDPTSVISQHINTRPVAPSWHTEHCPPDLEAVILQCLEKVPESRPASAEEVRDALARVDPEGRSSSHSGSSANPLDRLAQGVFVGRAKELERLRTAFDNAFAGHGNLVMLVGEPGIGKTRTSKEIETYARMRGAQVLVGKTHESAGMPAYWPWVEIGRSWSEQNNRDFTLLQPTLGDQGRELRRIYPELAQLAPNVPEPEEIGDPETAQFRLFDAVTTFVRAMAEHKPLLIVMDDLHWADKPTLMLLQHLARSLARMRVLIVGTYRDTDVVRTSALSETLANLNREPGFERIVLRGLERQEVEAYIRATANVQVSPSLIQRIHEETEGIPFFLAEVVNLMAEEGTLSADSSMEVALPDGVKEALGRRLDRLSPEANELLQVASVAGREFRHDTLLALGDHTEDELFRLLEEGLDARVVEEDGRAGRYRFTHALMQETLLDELSTTRKVRLHGQIGDALEASWGDRAGERASRLATHFVEAAALSPKYAQKAFRYSQLAARQAEAQAGWAEAARRYEDCLALVADTELELDEDEAALYLAAGIAFTQQGDGRSAWRALLHAIDLYRETGDLSGQCIAVIAVQGVWAPATRKRALVDEVLAALGESDPVMEARVIGALINRTGANRGEDDWPELAAKASAIARTHGLTQIEPMLLNAEMQKATATGRVDDRIEIRRRQFELFDREGMVREAANAAMLCHLEMHQRGYWKEADSFAETAVAYAERYNLGDPLDNIRWYQAERALAKGDFGLFDELVRELPRGVNVMEASTLPLKPEVRGELTRADIPDMGIAASIPNFQANVRSIRARLWFRLGDLERAAAEFREAASSMSELAIWRFATAFDAALELATPEELAEGEREWRDEGWRAVPGWPVDVLLGLIALSRDEFAGAEEELREAAVRWQAEDAPLYVGFARQGLAQVAAAQSDRRLALAELDAAAAHFRACGATYFLNQVIAKKLELQGLTETDPNSSILAVSSSVAAERPDLSVDAAPDGTVTLMFSDIVDSTALNERLGDTAWMALLREHSNIVEREVATHHGHIVKSMGDGFMVAFQSARDGLRCAIALQRSFTARNNSADQPIEARIGLHTGEAVRDHGDFFGKHVNLAARIGASAGGGEIVVSSLLAQLVEPSGEFALEAREARSFKGLEGEHVTYEAGWRTH
ncbi:MAG: protein kinase [Dehalococcoidia bacterium]